MFSYNYIFKLITLIIFTKINNLQKYSQIFTTIVYFLVIGTVRNLLGYHFLKNKSPTCLNATFLKQINSYEIRKGINKKIEKVYVYILLCIIFRNYLVTGKVIWICDGTI